MGTYTGTAGNDTITSAFVSAGVDAEPPGSKPSAADDTIDGGGGADDVNGGAGDDTIYVRGAGSVMRGGIGNDTMTYSTAEDAVSATAYGDAGNDYIDFQTTRPPAEAVKRARCRFMAGRATIPFQQ